MKKLKQFSKLFLLLSLMMVISIGAMATTADAPWVGTLDKLMNILAGPTSRIFAILAIVAVGFKMMFGQMEEGGKQGMKVAFGISIIFAAITWGPSFFGYSGSVLLG
jgi:type IV secretory pathway VirB2 component (pilin)